MFNAITQAVREGNNPAVSGQATLSDGTLRQSVASSMSAKLRYSKILRQQFLPTTKAGGAKICVEVEVRTEPDHDD
jgi:hypothetical protein